MQRAEILDAMKNVLDGIADANVEAVFSRPANNPDVMQAYRQWAIKTHQFGDVEWRLIEAMGLSQLENPDVWASALGSGSNSQVADRAGHGSSLLEAVTALLSRDSDSLPEVASYGVEQGDTEVVKLSIIVLEYEQPSTPERLVLALTSVQQLYDACAEISGERGVPISVIACDSGSSKLFDFSGSGELLKEVKETIFGIWDRIAHNKQNKTDEWLEQVAKSLPIMEQVAQMEAARTLSPEAAALLKRKLIEATCGVAKSGAVSPDLKHRMGGRDVRELARPVTRMLAAPSGGEPGDLDPDSETSATDLDGVDDSPSEDSENSD